MTITLGSQVTLQNAAFNVCYDACMLTDTKGMAAFYRSGSGIYINVANFSGGVYSANANNLVSTESPR